MQGAAIIWDHSCDNSTERSSDYDFDKGVKNPATSADVISERPQCCQGSHEMKGKSDQGENLIVYYEITS